MILKMKEKGVERRCVGAWGCRRRSELCQSTQEEWSDGGGFVSTKEEATIESGALEFDVRCIRTKGMNPMKVAKDKTRKDTRGMGRVGWYVKIEVACLFEEGGGDPVVVDGEREVHEVYGVRAVTVDPVEIGTGIHTALETSPASVVSERISDGPNANHVVDESTIEKQVGGVFGDE